MSTKDRLTEKETFVSRWSRKKSSEGQAADSAAPTVVDSPEQPDIPAIPLNTVTPGETTGRMSTSVEADRIKSELAAEVEPAPVLTDADMPDIETLGEGSDFTGFMSPGVSDKLRKLALRKLFAGAGFNIRDGLDDYDEDFTNFEPLGDIVTCDMKHRAELEEEKRQKALAEAEAAEQEAAEQEAAELVEQDTDEEPEQALIEEQAETPEHDEVAEAEELVETDPDAEPAKVGPSSV